MGSRDGRRKARGAQCVRYLPPLGLRWTWGRVSVKAALGAPDARARPCMAMARQSRRRPRPRAETKGRARPRPGLRGCPGSASEPALGAPQLGAPGGGAPLPGPAPLPLGDAPHAGGAAVPRSAQSEAEAEAPGALRINRAEGAVAVVGRHLGVEVYGLVVLVERVGEVRHLEQLVALVLDRLPTSSHRAQRLPMAASGGAQPTARSPRARSRRERGGGRRTSARAAVSSSDMVGACAALGAGAPAKHAERRVLWLRDRCSRVPPQGAAPREFEAREQRMAGVGWGRLVAAASLVSSPCRGSRRPKGHGLGQ